MPGPEQTREKRENEPAEAEETEKTKRARTTSFTPIHNAQSQSTQNSPILHTPIAIPGRRNMQDTPPTKKLGGLTLYTGGKPQESRGDTTMGDNSSDDTPESSMKNVPLASWFNSTPNGGAMVFGDTTMVESSREQGSPSSSTRKAVASSPAKNCLSHS